ncbi:MAG: hypothetical protein R3200_06975 [Xanthomonadales bacterium]|nr:hypothetical protein [Xanthomonadales bacterium]
MHRIFLSLAAVGALAGCNEAPQESPAGSPVASIDTPAAEGAALASLHADDAGRLIMSWVETGGDEARLLVAARDRAGWSQPTTVATGSDWFVNWADFPSLLANGDIWATHWLEKVADSTYAYAVRVALSDDGGQSWSEPLTPHDGSPTEHGFVSYFPDEAGIGLVWLDGRETGEGGPMTLRTATLAGDRELTGAALLDDRVCDCCQTDAALTAEGPVVVYRDRTEKEIRDIQLVARRGNLWQPPVRVAADNWTLPACPVNGPAVVADQQQVAVAWYSGAQGPRVSVVRSDDGGRSFGDPVVIETVQALGRVDAVLLDDGRLAVSFVDQLAPEEAEIAVALVNGSEVERIRIGKTDPARSSGFPRMALNADGLWVVWRQIDSAGERLQLHRVTL